MRIFLLAVVSFYLFSLSLFAETKTVNFKTSIYGAEPKAFKSLVGVWHIDKDGSTKVYAVDGRKWKRGLMSEGVVAKAKGMYGERYAEFLDNLEAYKYFPLSVYDSTVSFQNCTISVDFKAIGGRIDQAAGIVCNIKKNGDYLVVRANPLENNMVIFKLEKGRRSSVQWIRNVKTPTRIWNTLKVKIVDGNIIEGYLNNKLYVKYKNPQAINGKIGLWSKSDSYVLFNNFRVEYVGEKDKSSESEEQK